MKNSLWVYIGIAVAVVLMVVWVFSSAPKNLETPTGENATTSKATTTTTVPKKTTSPVATAPTEVFTNIFPQRGSYECNYEEVTQSGRTTNTIYFADGKMRGEFRTLGGSSNIMVYDGTYMYVWVEGQSVGTMSRPRSISDFPAIVPKDFTTGTVLGSGINSASWSCHPWAKVSSFLQKPTYVKF